MGLKSISNWLQPVLVWLQIASAFGSNQTIGVFFEKLLAKVKQLLQVGIILQLSKKRLMKLVYMQKYQWRCFLN
jgi:hypothetical protein